MPEVDSAISAAAAPDALMRVPVGRFHSPEYNIWVSMSMLSDTQEVVARITWDALRAVVEQIYGLQLNAILERQYFLSGIVTRSFEGDGLRP